MKLCLKYIGMNLKVKLSYRLSFCLAAFGQFITAFSSFFALWFIFNKIDAVDGFAFGEVLLCFAVVTMAFSIGEGFGGGFGTFSRLISDGQFDRMLVRPRGLITQIVFPYIDPVRIGLLAQSALTLAIAIPASGVEWTFAKVLVLALMISCGAVVFFAIYMFNATWAVFTTQGIEFLNLFTYGSNTFGRYPYSVYGKEVLRLLTFVIPLALFQYYPLLWILGRADGVLYALLPLVSLLFFIPCRIFFAFGVRKFHSTGS